LEIIKILPLIGSSAYKNGIHLLHRKGDVAIFRGASFPDLTHNRILWYLFTDTIIWYHNLRMQLIFLICATSDYYRTEAVVHSFANEGKTQIPTRYHSLIKLYHRSW